MGLHTVRRIADGVIRAAASAQRDGGAGAFSLSGDGIKPCRRFIGRAASAGACAERRGAVMAASVGYEMALDLAALRHLGIGLHSGAPDALSEAVANAWDADAGRVDISIGDATIAVEDDGCGMTVADANERYLRVGYERRRKGGGRTPKKGRPVMGRNGIGKLSPFSMADTVTVHSVRGGERHGFAMRARDMEDSARRGEPYRPEPIGAAPDLESGTRITLSGLRSTVYGAPLRRGLARRFSIIGRGGFEVAVNGDLIGAEDGGYRESLQYAWNFGGNGAGVRHGGPQEFSEEASVVLGGGVVPLRGWIGTAHGPGQLRDADTGESLNRIAVMARGRAVQEDMLGDLAWNGACRGCVVGEIHADFLDADDAEDIIATGRRRIKGDAPRYEALRAAVMGALAAVEQNWNGLRGKTGRDAQGRFQKSTGGTGRWALATSRWRKGSLGGST